MPAQRLLRKKVALRSVFTRRHTFVNCHGWRGILILHPEADGSRALSTFGPPKDVHLLSLKCCLRGLENTVSILRIRMQRGRARGWSSQIHFRLVVRRSLNRWGSRPGSYRRLLLLVTLVIRNCSCFGHERLEFHRVMLMILGSTSATQCMLWVGMQIVRQSLRGVVAHPIGRLPHGILTGFSHQNVVK